MNDHNINEQDLELQRKLIINKRRRVIYPILFFIVLISIAYPIINKYYLRPKRWKEVFCQGYIQTSKNIDKESIVNFCDCFYEKLHNKYGNVDYFPTERNYTKEDDYNLANCYIENIIPDSLKKFVRKNIDILVKKTKERRERRLRKQDSIAHSSNIQKIN